MNALLKRGEKAFNAGDTLVALVQFEAVSRQKQIPWVESALGYCLARERQEYNKGLNLCFLAIQEEPFNPAHYYQAGRIYLLARRKELAIKFFRRGLKLRGHKPIIDELRNLGIRKPPVFSSLPRQHALNRVFGLAFDRIGLRG